MVSAVLATLAAPVSAAEPGGPTLEPTAASLDVLIPIVTAHGTTIERRREAIVRGMRPLIPVVTAHGTIVEWHADERRRVASGVSAADRGAATADTTTDGPATSGHATTGPATTEDAHDAAPGGPSRAGGERAPTGRSASGVTSTTAPDRGTPTPSATAAAATEPASARPRPPVSFALRYEAGYFGPGEVNAELTALSDIAPSMVLLGGLGFAFEFRPVELLGLSVSANYLLSPPATVDEEVHYLHSVAGTVAARLYIPTVDRLDIAMGVEGSIHWAGYRGRSGVGPGIVWRFGVQLVDPDLPAVLATIFMRRAHVDADGFEIDLSGIGVMADFSFDL